MPKKGKKAAAKSLSDIYVGNEVSFEMQVMTMDQVSGECIAFDETTGTATVVYWRHGSKFTTTVNVAALPSGLTLKERPEKEEEEDEAPAKKSKKSSKKKAAPKKGKKAKKKPEPEPEEDEDEDFDDEDDEDFDDDDEDFEDDEDDE